DVAPLGDAAFGEHVDVDVVELAVGHDAGVGAGDHLAAAVGVAGRTQPQVPASGGAGGGAELVVADAVEALHLPDAQNGRVGRATVLGGGSPGDGEAADH